MARSVASGRTQATNRVAVQDVKASLKFDKASSTRLITSANLVTSTSAFTVAAWVNINDYTQYLSLFDCGANGGFRIETSTLRNLSFTVWNGAVQGAAVLAGYTINTWFPLVATFNAGVMKLYFNGAQVATATGHTMTATASAIGIGARASGYQNLGVNISNAVFYNGYAFTASDVTNYQSGILPSGATFIYPLQEGAGTTAYDTSGNGNHGTITAGTYTADVPTKKRELVGGNMVKNGDFEYSPPFVAATTTVSRWIDGTNGGSTTNSLFGWALSYVNGSVSAAFDATVSKSGTGSIKLSTLSSTGALVVTQTVSSSAPTLYEARNILATVSPNTSYTLTAWVKTSNASADSVWADIREFSGGLVVGVTTPTNKLGGTNDWTLVSTTVTTASTTRYIGIVLRNTVVGNISDAWFDDITLTPTVNTTRTAV